MSSGIKPELRKHVQGTQGLQRVQEAAQRVNGNEQGTGGAALGEAEPNEAKEEPGRRVEEVLVGAKGCSAPGEAAGWLGERSGAFRYEAVWSPGQGTSCARTTLPALALPVIPLPPNATGPLMSLTWHCCSVLHVSLSLPGVGCSGVPWAGCPGPAVLWAALAPWEDFLAPKGAGSRDLFIQRLN